MPRPNSLELRSLPRVAAGYVLAPVAGLTTLWLIWIVPNSPWPSALTIWGFMIAIGGAACLLVELLIVTPLLIGYRRYRWIWLNGRIAVAFAFAVGAMLALGWDVREAMHRYPGYSSWGPKGVVYFVNGVRTDAGWRLWPITLRLARSPQEWLGLYLRLHSGS